MIRPLDQPLATRRLLGDLKNHLGDPLLSEFRFAVAFAKIGPLLRLQPYISTWRAAGKKVVGVFGIDHKGTSQQALQFALSHFDDSYVTTQKGHSFHPKIYCFKGDSKAVAIIGSNNLTVGGTELNFESAIELVFSLPKEANEFKPIEDALTALLPANCVATYKLTATNLGSLIAAGVLLDETKKVWVAGAAGSAGLPLPSGAGKLPVKPASSLPATALASPTVVVAPANQPAGAQTPQPAKPLIPVSGFAIQIKPHHNGEIFLSKIAAQQNPAFFGMPFTGNTTPKLPGNPTYPERTPDPICNITVFGAGNAVIKALPGYSLNTVYYATKSEIRVTASPLVPHVPDYSVLVMWPSTQVGVDYEMQIFRPDSPDYPLWLGVCNQTMPSGGKVARKFGWF